MFRNEEELEALMQRLRIDDAPDPEHRRLLRQEMLAAFERARRRRRPKRIAWNWRKIMKSRTIRIAAAAVILAALGATAALLLVERSAAVAFADVQRQVRAAKTVSFNVTIGMAGSSRMSMRMLCKQPGLLRQEKFRFDGNAIPDGDVVNILDLPRGKMICLVPADKVAMRMELGKIPRDQQTGMDDFLGQMKEMIEGTSQPLGEKELGGRKAKGFRVTADANGTPFPGKTEMDIWVDAKTGLPLHIDMSLPGLRAKVSLSDIGLNEPMDDSLFSLEVPKGYEEKKMSFSLENPTEKDVLDGLKALAELYEGSFPDSLMQSGELPSRFGALAKRKKISEEEALAMSESIARMLYFAGDELKAGEFRYFGQGVKHGDANTPILWYKAKDQEKYRVVYGDLSVKESAKEQLPATQPATRPAG